MRLSADSEHTSRRPRALVLMRHGQTEWNLAGRRQGQLDSPLTAAGIETAELLADVVQGLDVDQIFSSPLGRARTTAEIVAERLHLEVQVLPDLAEVHHGTMAGLTADEIALRFPEQWHQRDRHRFRWRFPDGESYADSEQRALTALRMIAASGAALPLVVSHEMLGRMLRRSLLRLSAADALALKHPQDVAYLIEHTTSTALHAR